MSIELSLDEVLKVAGQMGFRQVQQETIQAPYLGEGEPPDYISMVPVPDVLEA